MRALIGLLSVRSGSISYRGVDITRQPGRSPRRAWIGYVPQGREVFAHMSVLDDFHSGNSSIARADSNPTKSMAISPFCEKGPASAPAR